MIRFSIAIPVYDDFDGAVFTIQSLLLHHNDRVQEIVVVDNHPEGRDSQTLAGFCRNADKRVRYTAYTTVGTAAAKEHAISECTGPYVVCVDSHVLLNAGALDALAKPFEQDPTSPHLYCGPLMLDNLSDMHTHMADVWRGEMRGIWAKDATFPFLPEIAEVPGQGMGCFAFYKPKWPHFNPEFRGFGGEEFYIHDKYRSHGAKVIRVAGFQWWHRFARPRGIPFQNKYWDKVRNYVIGHRELGTPLDQIHKYYVQTGLVTEQVWQAILAGKGEADCSACGQQPMRTLDQLYEEAYTQPSDISEHVKYLRELATKCDFIVDCGDRPGQVSVAFARGIQDRRENNSTGKLYCVSSRKQSTFDILNTLTDGNVAFIEGSARTVQVPLCALLFLDTDPHTGEQVYEELALNGNQSLHYIVLHDTTIFGEKAPNGQPGILHGVRKWLKDNPKWTAVQTFPHNNGLLVLSCHDEDKKQPPGWVEKAANYAKAKLQHIANGSPSVSLTVLQERLDVCSLCPLRNDEFCGACGCPVEKKAGWADQECPVGKWGTQ